MGAHSRLFIFMQAIWGESDVEVKATLQGLLEEEIEALLDEHELLPEPEFKTADATSLPSEATSLQPTSFSVLVPSSVDR